MDAALPGYLMVGSRAEGESLAGLPTGALAEVGCHLATAQRILEELFAPPHCYAGRYGHIAGHTVHFHVIPIYAWVAEAFARDERYRVLRQFYTSRVCGQGSDGPFDGAEMTLFVWREFCESLTPPPVIGPSVAETVELIREKWRKRAAEMSG